MRHPSVMMTALAGFIVLANAAAQHWHARQLAPELEKVHESIGQLHQRDWDMAEYLINHNREQNSMIRAIAENTGVPLEPPSEELKLSVTRVRKIYSDRLNDG